MSGDPDVLEYFRSKTSRKPIRSIDLQECEVAAEAESGRELEWGAWPVKRHLANQHLFVVKTSTRVFYLLAKTAEEMNCWPSPVLSTHATFSANQDPPAMETDSAARDEPIESDASIPLDYLYLSQCETGRKSITRCDSMSTSERSLEQSSLENVTDDVFSPATSSCLDSAPSPFGGPYGMRSLSSCPVRGPGEVFRFDSPFCATPPPLPPKPTHMSDCHGHEDPGGNQGQPGLLPRRTSLSGGEHFRRGEFELTGRGKWNKTLSLNLSMLQVNNCSESQSDDSSYVPMASPPTSSSSTELDGYIPMSPNTFPIALSTDGKPNPSSPAADMEPPPINRSLKPRRRVKPPPLDLSTISECPTHLPLIRTMTEPSVSPRCIPWDRGRGLNGTEQEGNETSTSLLSACDSAPFFRSSYLDYLSLDFNSASPSPVQKKPLPDEQRVDYVQVDEKKTQALQNTRTEWKDSRQPKV
ncbi:GRB2-associated-binding protein 3 [Bagarius yarrelli]|uniref:GRB2-associated-binding protein 3 n=1 Tax=Bagarius yarrelli TaxID=175774 RepID=A0A556VWG0_BAGYA|nr:GRB2-associated-binding protein 3 [Bagarius yarrelli]